MDLSLRAALTSPRVGCTDDAIDALVAADITNVETLKALSDNDFRDVGISIGLRARIRKALQAEQQPSCSALPGPSFAPPLQPALAGHAAAATTAISSSQKTQSATAAAKAAADGAKGGKRKAAYRHEDAQLGGGIQSWLRAERGSGRGLHTAGIRAS